MTPPIGKNPRQTSVLETLRNLKARQLEYDSQITFLVRAAVAERCSWRAIGEVLGVSGQAAWEKYRTEDARKIATGEK